MLGELSPEEARRLDTCAGAIARVLRPDRPWVADDGTKRWAEIVKLPTTLKRRVDDAVLATWGSA